MAEPMAIYDLDRTITRTDTFKAFLCHAVPRLAPWRLALLPFALPPVLAFLAGWIDRGRLKEIMVGLMLGSVPRERLTPVIEGFVTRLLAGGCHAEALREIAAAQAAGHVVVIATASFDFYVEEIARRLGITHVIATRARWDEGGRLAARIDGANCYGEEKLRRVEAYFADRGWQRAAFAIRFYSDHHTDAPSMAWADHAYAVNPTPALKTVARSRQWAVLAWT